MENSLRRILRILWGLLFLSPFLIWVFYVPHWSAPTSEILGPLLGSFVQAAASGLGSVLFGGAMALGLLSFTGRSEWLDSVLLFPNLVPSLFLILSILNVGVYLPGSVEGWWGVVLAHVLLNSGLVALALVQFMNAKLAGYLDLAEIEGAGRWMTWREVIFPSLKNEMLFLFLFVFSICLTSFAIPLVLSGSSTGNLEMLIYETLHVRGDWGRAILYAAMQSAVLFGLAIWVPKPIWSISTSRSRRRNLGLALFRPLVFLPSLVLIFGWSVGLAKAPLTWLPGAGEAALNTGVIALSTGFLTLLLCLWVSYVWPHRALSVFTKGYLTPSSVITGFAFLLLPGDFPIFKIIGALTLVSFPLLFRWLGQAALENVEQQIAIARTLGASPSQILFEITWRQCGPTFFRMSAVASLWACGDFALSSVIAEGRRTWPLIIADLVNTYRIDLASVYVIPMIAMGLVSYFFFIMAGRYVHR